MCPIIEPDFSERPPLQPGKYRAIIKKCEVKTSQKGNTYLGWVFEAEPDNTWVYLNTTYSGRGAQIFKEVIRAAVQPAYEGGPVDTDTCIGKSVLISVDRDPNPQQKYPIVTKIEADPDSFDSYEP